MIKRTYHQLLLISAFLACVVTSVIFRGTGLPRINPTRIESSSTLMSSDPGVSSGAAKDGNWKPPTRSDEDGWHFELFTPPPMFWDAPTHAFKLMRLPATDLAAGSPPSASALHTDADHSDPITPRLQLLGYVQRDPEEIAGIFQNLQTGEVRVAPSGSSLDDWQVRIVRIELEAARIMSDAVTVQLPRARAFVRDEAAGCTYPLSTDETPAPPPNLARRVDVVPGEDFSRDG